MKHLEKDDSNRNNNRFHNDGSWASFRRNKLSTTEKNKVRPSGRFQKGIPKSTNAAHGEMLYNKKAKPMARKNCHGDKGDGMEKLGKALKPNSRSFAYSDSMKKISAGQMFWVIKNISAGTGMVAHKKTLKD